jgi:hypothetical protein
MVQLKDMTAVWLSRTTQISFDYMMGRQHRNSNHSKNSDKTKRPNDAETQRTQVTAARNTFHDIPSYRKAAGPEAAGYLKRSNSIVELYHQDLKFRFEI